jgi:ELWxxDGT repeat protein
MKKNKLSFFFYATPVVFMLLVPALQIDAQTMVKDIAAGAFNSSPVYLTAVNGTLFFQAWDATNGKELWKSDGTPGGTVLVKDIRVGAGDSNPSGLVNVNGTLYFSADDGTDGIELWKSDGSAAGTVLVKDIMPGINGSGTSSLINMNGTLYFTANDGTGTELWKSDGSSGGTVLVKDIYPGSSGSSPFDLTVVNSSLFFGATDGTHGAELWKSDGSSGGTVMVKDIFPGSAGSTFTGTYSLADINGIAYFNAENGANGFELWKSDGTDTGTVLVKDIYPGSNGSSPNNITNINGIAYFIVNDGAHGEELWKSDGSDMGTVMVKDIYPGSFGSFNDPVADLTSVNGTLYFSATDGINGSELWKSDGTDPGTVMVKDINPGSNSAMSGLFPYYTNIGGTIYFNAFGSAGNELWKSDGTIGGTVMLNDINSGNNSSYPSYLANVAGTLFFSADDGVHGIELWKYDTAAVNVNELAAEPIHLNLYPNPTHGNFLIHIQDEKSVGENREITISNAFGETIYSNSTFKQQSTNQISISGISEGIYFVKVSEMDRQTVQKLIIQ